MWKRLGFTMGLAAMGVGLGAAQPEMRPYAIDWSQAHATAVDLSRFLAGPAGGGGFLRVDGEHIVKPDGTRFRFWGVNLCGPDCFPSATEAEQLAGDLARMGINVVRFHHLDSNWGRSIFEDPAKSTRQLSAENLERLDYLIAQLKRWGIYANLNLNVLRKFREGDGVRDAERLGIGKGATYFNPRLVELQREYARALLTHRNPHTGQEYRREPAVAVVEMVNENSLLEAWVSGRLVGRDDQAGDTWSPIPVSYAEELTDLYNVWLTEQLAPGEVDRLRTESQAGPGGRVPRLRPDQFGGASRERFHAEARFYRELEDRYFAGMKSFLRDEVGVRSILVGTADHNDTYSGLGHVQANQTFDLIDGHGYWEHPRLGGETWIKNTPMVNDPLDSTVVQFARTPVVGQPFTISEVNHPFPHEFAAEGFPILTAYALLHDWDGIYWFTWGRGRRGNPADGIQRNGWFDLSNDPVKVALLHSAALMWHRQDVARARRTVVRSYTSDQLIESLRADRAKARPFFLAGFPRSTPLQHATRFRIAEQAQPTYPPGAPLGAIVADTGELGWWNADRQEGVVTVDTPRTQGLMGFVRDGGRETRHLAAAVDNAFCTVLLASLDDQPVERSHRLLLTTAARMSNTGFAWKDDHQTVAEWGQGPVRVEPVTGQIRLRGLQPARQLYVRPLAANGVALPAVLEAEEWGGAWTIRLGDPVALWYVVEVRRNR